MRYSWQKMYIEIAKVVAKRSEDPRTKVGAVLVKDGCIIGVGYNGVPRHCNYAFDWNTDEKYKFVIHAEMNAIANANMQGVFMLQVHQWDTSSSLNSDIINSTQNSF